MSTDLLNINTSASTDRVLCRNGEREEREREKKGRERVEKDGETEK